MFFVGATGQLLTLILTVCLPFVFLVSSQPKTIPSQETVQLDLQKSVHEVSSQEVSSLDFSFIFADKLQINNIEPDNTFIQKIPPENFQINWKTFYAESSGNKAPPSFRCFYC
jgi:hypothetical protein